MEWSGGEEQLYKAINRMKSLFMKFATMNFTIYDFLLDLSGQRTHAKS